MWLLKVYLQHILEAKGVFLIITHLIRQGYNVFACVGISVCMCVNLWDTIRERVTICTTGGQSVFHPNALVQVKPAFHIRIIKNIHWVSQKNENLDKMAFLTSMLSCQFKHFDHWMLFAIHIYTFWSAFMQKLCIGSGHAFLVRKHQN